MMSCDTLTFYNQLWCPKSQSIHLALEASNVPHKTVELANESGHACDERESSIPALKNGKTTSRNYREAIALLKLIPEDPVARGKQERILEHFVKYILPYFEKSVILKSPREGLDLFIEALSFIENQLICSGGKYFGGSQPNAVDYGLFPYLDKIGKWMPAFEPKECPRTQTWIKVMREHPLVVKILSGNSECQEHFENYSASLKAKNSA